MKKIFLLTVILAITNLIHLKAQTNFVGLTLGGGTSNNGVIFEYSEASSICDVKVNLDETISGRNPNSSFTQAGSKLYATSAQGGALNLGCILEYDPLTALVTKKVEFDGTIMGDFPKGKLVLFNGKLYGMTQSGGANGKGVLFEYDPSTEIYTKKFDFTTSSGGFPVGSLIAFGNKLYGMTTWEGTYSAGTIFSFSPSTNVFTKLADFGNGTDGKEPNGAFTIYNNKLYGMTKLGGNYNYGTLFEFDTLTNIVTINVHFDGSTKGANPVGSLFYLNNKFWGMTYSGGINNVGTLFEYNLPNNTFLKKIDFNGAVNGGYPKGSFILSGGKFWGVTAGGGAYSYGTIFNYDTTSNTLINKFSFASTDGNGPVGELVEILPGQTQSIINWQDITVTYGDEIIPAAAATSGLAITYTIGDPTILDFGGGIFSARKAGTTTVTATQPGNTSFAPTDSVILVTVLKKDLKVLIDDFTRTPCEQNPTFTFTYDGLLADDGELDIDLPPTLSTNGGSLPGVFAIVGSGGMDDNYNLIYDDGELTITGNYLTPQIIGKNVVSVDKEAFYRVDPFSAGYTYSWYYTGTGVEQFGDSISSNYIFFVRKAATSGTLVCIVTQCGYADTLSMPITVNSNPTLENFLTPPTCEIKRTDCDSSYIISFNIDKIFETPITDCSPSGYSDYTDSDVTANLFIGEAYTINLVAGGFPSYFGLWIDYNNDGDFGDAQEMVSANFDPGFQYIVPNILVPNLASIEGPKRMRIRTRLTRPFTALESCPDGTEAGETEDYLLNFEIRPALNAPNFLSPNNDGENDFFVIRGIDFSEENKLLIMDNMGKVILEESDYKNNWPSQNNLASLKNGVYYFIFKNGHSEIKSYIELSR